MNYHCPPGPGEGPSEGLGGGPSAREIAAMLGKPPPTAEQVAVIEAPLEPNLVVAGAGSGKTETMAARVVWLIAGGLVRPDQVLGLTFTRKAAGELAQRVTKRLAALAGARGRGDGEDDLLARPTVATYNSYAASLVTDHGLRLGIEPTSRLLGEAARWQLAAEVVEGWEADLDTDKGVSTVVEAVMALAGAMGEHLVTDVVAQRTLDEMVERLGNLPLGGKTFGKANQALVDSLTLRRSLLDLVAEFRARKRAAEAMDFGDQIAFGAALAQQAPQVAVAERARFKIVLLDEYQDTSYAQVELLAHLFGDGHAVTAVGDPHQSIYGWRGASAAGLSHFPERFRRSDGAPAEVLNLSTSWRNDAAILQVANLTSSPLRTSATVEVLPLALRPGASPGVVSGHVAATVEDEANHLAAWIKARWRPGRRRVTAAVLCRKRAQFPLIEAALRRQGLPVEVVGLGGLLTTAEVTDVIALLQASHDPTRGDWLLRLLTGPRVNLGAADLHALGSWAKDLLAGDPPADDPPAADRAPSADQPTGTDQPPSDAVAPSPQEADSVDARSLIDALDNLPVPGQAASDGRSLTAEAHRRLTSLARVLRHLRSVTYLSLPELVVAAERSLGLDVEVATVAALAEVIAPEHAERLSTRGRSHLDAFRDVAANFARSTEQATLGAFLAWLAAAAREENGLDRPLHDPDPDAVQIITAHGAKGLEWDVVAVPGLSDGVFPADPERAGGRTDAGWLTNARTLPYPLRGDAADLPPFAWERFTDTKELAEGQQAFRLACGAHQFAEERRLAYVAFTRARTELLLLGHYWGDPKAPRPLSPFLGELLEAGLVAPEPDWADPPGEGVENPRLAAQTVVLWPRGSDLVAGRLAAGDAAMGDAAAPASPQHLLARAAQRVREATSALPDDELGAQTALLLAERQRQPAAQVMLPAHLSASALVRLAADREEFARQLRRPLPAEPTVAARRGTEFHAWVEQFYSRPALLDLDDFDLDDFDLDDPRRAASAGLDLTALKAAFESSAWAGLQPVAIEVDVETPLAGVMTRCRMDAVFPDPDGAPGAQIVVDWKTGHPPSNPADQRAREVQLAVYRLAWSRFTGLPLAQVSAAFHYVGSDTTVRPARLSTEAELEALIKG